MMIKSSFLNIVRNDTGSVEDGKELGQRKKSQCSQELSLISVNMALFSCTVYGFG